MRNWIFLNLNLSRFFERVLKAKWGYDNKNGDFCLRIWPFLVIFYKWSSPTVVWCWNKNFNFIELNDGNSKSIYQNMPGTDLIL